MKNVILISTLVFLTSLSYAAAESPRFRGPAGDGKFPATGLMQEWPPDGPPVAWITEGIGEGYSSVSVADGNLYITGMTPDEQGHLLVLDFQGTILDKITYGPETQDGQATGPRATPTIDGNRAYLLSGLGVVSTIDLDKKALLWQVDILKRFNGENIQWTLAESLLIDGDKVICTPGGEKGVVVALDKMTGETVWAMTELQDKASYCAPGIITHNGRRILVTMTAKNVLGLDPETGKLLWHHHHETDYDIHAVTPIYSDGLLYYTSGYGSGGGALELSEDGSAITPKWTDKTLDCQHHGVILLDGYIYGLAHKSRDMTCLELTTGKVMWTSRDVTQGNTVYADGMLYIYEGPKKGRVSLVKPSPEGLDLKGQVMVTAGTEKHWAHPTISDGMLLIRHGDALIAYDVKQN